jgi:hypothetical protein
LLAPAGLALPVLLLAAELYLAFAYRSAYASMLHARVEPRSLNAPLEHARQPARAAA